MDIPRAERFKALGVESRLRIVELLSLRGSLCVNALSHHLGLTPSAVSQHLKTLKYAGLVRGRRKASHIHYEVNRPALRQSMRLLARLYAGGRKPAARCRIADDCPVKKGRRG